MREQIGDDAEKLEAGLAEWRKTHPVPQAASLTDVANHVDHIRKVAGVDHVGLGGDYEGFRGAVTGLEDVSKYPDLLAELMRRGWTRTEIKQLAGLNVLRVMRSVEKIAMPLQRDASVK